MSIHRNYNYIVDLIKRKSCYITWSITGNITSYAFKVEDLLPNQISILKSWVKDHPQNWGIGIPYTYPLAGNFGISLKYSVKSITDISTALKNRRTETMKENPCAELNYSNDDKLDSLRYLTELSTFNINNTPTEKHMKISEQVKIGKHQFDIPNLDVKRAEDLMLELSTSLLELKTERKARRKLFEGKELPFLLERKYTVEMEEFRAAIDLLDEITEFE